MANGGARDGAVVARPHKTVRTGGLVTPPNETVGAVAGAAPLGKASPSGSPSLSRPLPGRETGRTRVGPVRDLRDLSSVSRSHHARPLRLVTAQRERLDGKERSKGRSRIEELIDSLDS